MAQLSDDDVLLLWRALRAFRSGAKPPCQPRGKPVQSACPLEHACPRWHGDPDDRLAMLEETLAQMQARQARWPCARLMDLLEPGAKRISAG
jgi:hypothetical protein